MDKSGLKIEVSFETGSSACVCPKTDDKTQSQGTYRYFHDARRVSRARINESFRALRGRGKAGRLRRVRGWAACLSRGGGNELSETAIMMILIHRGSMPLLLVYPFGVYYVTTVCWDI